MAHSCVGKTTIGAVLARRLGEQFFDLDAFDVDRRLLWPASSQLVDQLPDAPDQVVREIQQAVPDCLTLGRREVHGLEGRRVGVQPDSEAQTLIEHELVKALHGSGRTSLELDRDDARAALEHEIDLSGTPAFTLPRTTRCLSRFESENNALLCHECRIRWPDPFASPKQSS